MSKIARKRFLRPSREVPKPPSPPIPAARAHGFSLPADDAHTTLEHLRQVMRDFVRERQWHKYHTPRNLAASVAVEAGELLELFQWLTPSQAKRRSKSDPAFRQAVGEEMCDVLMYLISLANAVDIDLAHAIHHKMNKNRAKYPPEKFRGHYERPLNI